MSTSTIQQIKSNDMSDWLVEEVWTVQKELRV